MGPRNVGPQDMGPQNIGPQDMGQQTMGPQNTGPQDMGPYDMTPPRGDRAAVSCSYGGCQPVVRRARRRSCRTSSSVMPIITPRTALTSLASAPAMGSSGEGCCMSVRVSRL